MAEVVSAGRSLHQPTHPGELLRDEVLPALGLSVTKAAALLHVSRQALHAVLSERAAVTPEMAVRLGKLCDRPATCGRRSGTWRR